MERVGINMVTIRADVDPEVKHTGVCYNIGLSADAESSTSVSDPTGGIETSTSGKIGGTASWTGCKEWTDRTTGVDF